MHFLSDPRNNEIISKLPEKIAANKNLFSPNLNQ